RYRLYPVWRPHPAVSHFTNLASATRAARGLGAGYDVAIAGSYDAALALGWARVVPGTPLVFLYHSEFYSEWVHARTSLRALMGRYMAAVERRVFALSARIVAVSEFSATQIRSRLPGATDRVRVIPTGVETDYFVPAADRAAARAAIGVHS